MAITDNGTAAAVNTVLGFLLPSTREPWQGKVELEDAIEAAEQKRVVCLGHEPVAPGTDSDRYPRGEAVTARVCLAPCRRHRDTLGRHDHRLVAEHQRLELPRRKLRGRDGRLVRHGDDDGLLVQVGVS